MKAMQLFTRYWERNLLNIRSLFYSRFLFFCTLAGICFFPSCEKVPEPLFSNSVIKGYADLGNWNENDSVMVVAIGPYGRKVAITGESGQYIFEGLGNGTYRLDFTKEGYGTIRQYGIQLFGNDTFVAKRVSLFKKYSNYKIPEFRKISFGQYPRSNPEILYVILETNQTGGNVPLIFFMDVNSSVSYKKFNHSTSYFQLSGPYELIKDYKLYITQESLPYERGTEVFIIAYVCNPDEFNSGYFDRYFGIEGLSTLETENHSSVMSFIMP